MSRPKNLKTQAEVIAHRAAGVTVQATAKALGISPATVKRYQKEAVEAMGELNWKAFLVSLDKKLPDLDIVNTLGRNMRQTEHLPTSQNAVMAAVKLKYGKHLVETGEETPATAPLFHLPPGSRVAIEIGTQPGTRPDTKAITISK